MSDKFCIKCQHHRSRRSAIFKQGTFETVRFCKKTEVVFRDVVTGKKTNLMAFKCEVERSEAGRCGPQARFYERRYSWIREPAIWGLLAQIAVFCGFAAVGLTGLVGLTYLTFGVPAI